MAKKKKAKRKKLKKIKLRGPDGKMVTRIVVDTRSPTLSDDLLEAFRWNVRRIRREHRKLGLKD